MNEKLEAALNSEVQLLNGEAETLFTELGIIEKLKCEVSDEVAKQVIFFTQHLTHWIIAIHRTGNFDSERNEFEAICFPKMKVPQMTFERLAVGILDPTQEAVVQREETLPKPAEPGSETLPLF
jgi:hypothetical protein